MLAHPGPRVWIYYCHVQRIVKHPLATTLDRMRITALLAAIRTRYMSAFYGPLLRIVSDNDTLAAAALARWALLGELFRPDEVRCTRQKKPDAHAHIAHATTPPPPRPAPFPPHSLALVGVPPFQLFWPELFVDGSGKFTGGALRPVSGVGATMSDGSRMINDVRTTVPTIVAGICKDAYAPSSRRPCPAAVPPPPFPRRRSPAAVPPPPSPRRRSPAALAPPPLPRRPCPAALLFAASTHSNRSSNMSDGPHTPGIPRARSCS